MAQLRPVEREYVITIGAPDMTTADEMAQSLSLLVAAIAANPLGLPAGVTLKGEPLPGGIEVVPAPAPTTNP